MKYIVKILSFFILFIFNITNSWALIPMPTCMPKEDCCKGSTPYCCPNGKTGTGYRCPEGWYLTVENECKRNPQIIEDETGYRSITWGSCAATSYTYDCYWDTFASGGPDCLQCYIQ